VCRTNPDDVMYSGAPGLIQFACVIPVRHGTGYSPWICSVLSKPFGVYTSWILELYIGSISPRISSSSASDSSADSVPCHSGDKAPDSLYNIAHSSPIKSVMP
jgi:hypothetical protein